jgi:hypothetical protein
VLVIKVWCEPGTAERVRGRIKARLEVVDRRTETLAVRSTAEMSTFVDDWLARFIAAGPPDGGG